MNPVPNPPNTIGALSRTNSALSFSSTSEDDASLHTSQTNANTVTVMNSTRRTRKRFTNVQLTMLENLFHQNSHPSREDREAVAKAGGMEIKSVTIWFQNKRQTERKSAASNSGQANTFNEANVQPNITSTIHTFSLHNDSHSTSRTASPSYTTPFSTSRNSSAAAGGYSLVSSSHHHHHQTGHHYHHHNSNNSHTSTANATSSSSSSRLSLDRVASRSELRNVVPRTPSSRRSNNLSGQIYDNMPSSPLAPPVSPPSRDYVDFSKNAKSRRTLEWACAAARLVDGSTSGSSGTTHGHGHGHHHHHRHHHCNESGTNWSASAEATAQGHNIINNNGNRGRSAHQERSHNGSGGNPPMREHQQHHGQNHRYSSSSSHHQHRSSSTRRDRLSRSSSSMTLRGESSMNSVSSSTSTLTTYRSPAGHSHTHGHGYEHYNGNYYSTMDAEVTDSEEDQDHEAITPPSTWGRNDMRWSATRSSSSSMATSPALSSTSREGSGYMMSLTSAAAAAASAEGKAPPRADDDDAMFKAALALCGLGGRRV